MARYLHAQPNQMARRTCYIIKNTLAGAQDIPVFSPGNSNIIQVDKFYVDYDTIGDGVLLTAFQR